MCGHSTIRIMQALSGGEYSDPFEVRSLINKDSMRPDAFAERLWRMLHISSRCPVVERFCSDGASAVEAALTDEWRLKWNGLCVSRKEPPEELEVVDFLRGGMRWKAAVYCTEKALPFAFYPFGVYVFSRGSDQNEQLCII